MRIAEIVAGLAYDEAEKRAYYSQPAQPWFTGIWNRIKRLFH